MSDAEPAVGRGEIWIEKYRPRTLDEVVGQEEITERLESYIERNDLPNLLFSGPAGVGKCVTGETPVLTNRGVERIANVVGDVDGFGTPEKDLHVLTLDDDGEFRYVEPTHVFGKTAEEIVAIETRDGGDLSVTPEHRLLVFDEDGLQWTRAEDLAAGDRIVRPLRTPLPDTGGDLDWIGSMDGDRTVVHLTEDFAKRHGVPTAEPSVGSNRRVVHGIGTGATDGTLSNEDGISGDTGFDAVETACPLSALRRMEVPREELREHIDAVEYGITQNDRARPIRPPWEVTPPLATFLGLTLTGAHIDQTGITFYNTDERLLDRFERSVREVFAIATTNGEENGVPYVRATSRTLIHVLASCFAVSDGVADGDGIGSTIVCSDEESRKAFVRAVFDAEGTVTQQGTIEVAQTNGTLITVLAYLLSGFGIPGRRTTERHATNGTEPTREYHVLRISGAVNLGRFEGTIGLTDDDMAARIARHAARDGAANPGADLHYDEVERVDSIDEPRRVFDLTVPGTKNYVAGTVPTVMHNTTSAHAIAREIYGDDWRENFMELNASDERGIDVVRDRIKNFARSSFGGYDYRVIFLDEADSLCVPPGTEVVTGYPSSPTVKPIEEVHEEGEPIPSVDFETNEIQSDKGKLVDSGVADFFELELEDGRTVLASPTHPFFVVGEDGTLVECELRELQPGDEIADFRDDVGVSRCEVCGDWTAGRFCSAECKNEEHNRAMQSEDTLTYGTEWSDKRRDTIVEKLSDGGRASVSTVGIRRIEYSHRGKAYNITMEDTPNFMLANGILTHNTSDAQSALRRTMEQFSHNTRFILSCNYSSQIIDPIQSRCAVFRFGPLPEEAVAERIREIADAEGITTTDDGVDALVYAANGDMRKAINGLQAAAVLGETVDDEAVYTITSTARPEDIEKMVESALDGEFTAARSVLDELLTEKGLAGGDVIDQLHRSVWEFGVDDEAAVRIMDRIGEADYRITEGANERIQLEALLASLALSAVEE